MENNCNYSDEWQPYINDYDKFEYDVKLKDGTIVENCYPNGGLFNSMSDDHNNMSFDEKEVIEIRFSQKPRTELNNKVSSSVMDIEYKKRIEQKHFQNKEEVYQFSNPYKDYAHFLPNTVISKYKTVPVRTEPKIGRNSICPKCESGLKYKRCCGVGK